MLETAAAYPDVQFIGLGITNFDFYWRNNYDRSDTDASESKNILQELGIEDTLSVKTSPYNMFFDSNTSSLMIKRMRSQHQGSSQLIYAAGYTSSEATQQLPMPVILTTNVQNETQASSRTIYLKQDMQTTVDELVNMLLNNEFHSGAFHDLPYHLLSNPDDDWSFKHLTPEDCRKVLQELIDGTRTCPHSDSIDPDNYTIRIVYEHSF